MSGIPARVIEVVAEAEGPLGGPRVNFYTLTATKPDGRDMTLAIPACRIYYGTTTRRPFTKLGG